MKKLAEIAVVCMNPVEALPPLQNLLADPAFRDARLVLYTMREKKYGRGTFSAPGVKVVRTPARFSRHSLVNLWDKLYFCWRTFIGLAFQKPDRILYVESNSALPVCWYRRLLNRKAGIAIHYYEYSPPERFAEVPWDRFCHRLERRCLYPAAQWVSHCNAKRLELFCADTGISAEVSHVVPNYPPASWKDAYAPRKKITEPIRLLYIGACSMQSMFVKEVAEWVVNQNGRVVWDLYSFQIEEQTKAFLTQLNSPYVRFFEHGVAYNKIPELASRYDVGLLLYKALTLNYRYNETNKFFEYLACGLDVWFPDTMELLRPKQNEDTVPRICMFNVAKLDVFNRELRPDRSDCRILDYDLYAETAQNALISHLKTVNRMEK